jgi:nicotinamide mononucleotide transporter
LNDLLSQFLEIPIAEWIAVLTGFVYIVLATRNNPNCWYWGIVSCGIWMVCTWVNYKLLADAFLQFVYVVMGVIGLYNWHFRKADEEKGLLISRVNIKEAVLWIAGGIVVSLGIAWLLSLYTSAAATHLDTLTTTFSLIATYWLIKRKIENWALWIVADITYVYLYFSRGAELFAILYIVYALFAAYGFFHWIMLLNKEDKTY